MSISYLRSRNCLLDRGIEVAELFRREMQRLGSIEES
jgi:hypothetical protein